MKVDLSPKGRGKAVLWRSEWLIHALAVQEDKISISTNYLSSDQEGREFFKRVKESFGNKDSIIYDLSSHIKINVELLENLDECAAGKFLKLIEPYFRKMRRTRELKAGIEQMLERFAPLRVPFFF